MAKFYDKLGVSLLLPVMVFIGINCSKTPPGSSGQPTPVVPATPVTATKSDVAMWLTNSNQSALLAKQNIALNFSAGTNSNPNILVDTTTTYQTIDGFGFCLTGGSATVINSLPAAQQNALLNELFLTDSTHIGISYLRISMGASDMSATDFTYDDMPAGQTDVSLANFSIGMEQTDLIPILKKIVALNPAIKILATPWTAPVWMKLNTTGNNGFSGGSMDTTYHSVYAQYFVKYIQAMKAQGIAIDAVTPQNEPLNANNNPAMVMQSTEEDSFIKNDLGPQFKAAGLSTKIIIYDHNTDQTDYPLQILADPAAAAYVDGSAFHLYAGAITALTPVHNQYANKNIYFTEQYTSTAGTFAGDLNWHITNLIIGATQNWSRNVLEWNLATDASAGPHTTGGCSVCQGALTISGQNIQRNVSYYIIAHASKFVRPGAIRIATPTITNLPNVAFKNADGSKVLIVLNGLGTSQTFNIQFNNKIVTSTLNGGSVATYVW
jgi:glucosylceramidase